MRIVLAPWEWSDGEWRKPGGDYAGGCVDLRTFAEAGAPGPAPLGLGLFAYEDLPTVIDVAADLGDDPLAVMSVSARRDLALALGLESGSLGGSTLAEVLAEFVLGIEADPSGQARTKPLRMNARGARLHLKGFGDVYDRSFDRAHPAYAQTLAVRRLDYERVRTLRFARAEEEISRGRDREEAEAAALDALQRWTGWDARALGASEEDLLPETRLSDGSREPSTVLTETWPTNSTTISSGQDEPWNEDSGDVQVASGALEPVDSEVQSWGRCTTDLSSDDHYHEATGTLAADTAHHRASVTARKIDSTTDTCYEQRLRRDNSSALNKRVSGTPTNLDSTIGAQAAGSYALRVEADGSSITGEVDAGTNGPVTDTDITGNLQCGYLFFASISGTPTLDSHEFGDLAAGAVDRSGLARGLARGLFRGVG